MQESACHEDRYLFLAHLSRRLTRWVYRMGVEPASMCASVGELTLSNMNNQKADHNQILSEASLGWGKGCSKFWIRTDWSFGFYGNR